MSLHISERPRIAPWRPARPRPVGSVGPVASGALAGILGAVRAPGRVFGIGIGSLSGAVGGRNGRIVAWWCEVERSAGRKEEGRGCDRTLGPEKFTPALEKSRSPHDRLE